MKTGRARKNGNAARPFGTLAKMAVTKRQSAEWQKLAQTPAEEFERMLREQGKPSTGSLIREWHGAKPRRLAPGLPVLVPADRV
jgi:hypothetical protein